MTFNVTGTKPHTDAQVRLAVQKVLDLYNNQGTPPPPPPPTGQKYNITRLGQIIPKPAGMSSKGPMWPCPVDMRDNPLFPHDFACYFSTDHDQGAGGIWVAGADGDLTTWTVLPNVFTYPGSQQTETPHVVEVGSTYYMTGHSEFADQKTWLATSPDGLSWTPHSNIIEQDMTDTPGDSGHTGYFRWVAVDGDFPFLGTTLLGSGPSVQGAIWGAQMPEGPWMMLDIVSVDMGRSVEGSGIPNPSIVPYGAPLESIRPMANGNYSIITSISELGVGSNIAGGIFAAEIDSGFRVQSRPVPLIMPDTASLYSTPAVLDVDGTRYIFFMEQTGGVNSIGLASSPIPDTDEIHVPLSPAIPTVMLIDEDHDFTTSVGLPAGWSYNGAPGATSALGAVISLPATSGANGTLSRDAITPVNYEFIEIMCCGVHQSPANVPLVPQVYFGPDPLVPDPLPSLRALTFSTLDGETRFHIQYSGGTVLGGGGGAADRPYDFGWNDSYAATPKDVGLRIWPQARKCVMLGEGGVEVSDVIDLPSGWPMSTPVHAGFNWLTQDSSAPLGIVERVTFKAG